MTGSFIKIALAAEGLVPQCPGGVTNCGEAELLKLGINVINFMIQGLAFPLVVLFFLIGGFLLLTSGGSPNRIEQGKKAITGAVIGLVIVLTSVVVINTLLAAFTKCEVKLTQIGKLNCNVPTYDASSESDFDTPISVNIDGQKVGKECRENGSSPQECKTVCLQEAPSGKWWDLKDNDFYEQFMKGCLEASGYLKAPKEISECGGVCGDAANIKDTVPLQGQNMCLCEVKVSGPSSFNKEIRSFCEKTLGGKPGEFSGYQSLCTRFQAWSDEERSKWRTKCSSLNALDSSDFPPQGYDKKFTLYCVTK